MKHNFRIVVLANGTESPGDTKYASFTEASLARFALLDEAQQTDPNAMVAIDEYDGDDVKQCRFVPATSSAPVPSTPAASELMAA